MRAIFWFFFLLGPIQAIFLEELGSLFGGIFAREKIAKTNSYICNKTSDNEFIQIIQRLLKEFSAYDSDNVLLWSILFQKEVDIEQDPTISNEERTQEIYKLWSTELEHNFTKDSPEFKKELTFIIATIKATENFIECFNLEADGSVEALLFSSGLDLNFTRGTDIFKREFLRKRLEKAKLMNAKMVNPLGFYYKCSENKRANISEESLLNLLMAKINYYISLEKITGPSKRASFYRKLELLSSDLNQLEKNQTLQEIWKKERIPLEIREKELQILNSIVFLAEKFTTCHQLASTAETGALFFSCIFDDDCRMADKNIKRRFLWKSIQLAKRRINQEEIETKFNQWNADFFCTNTSDQKLINMIEKINGLFIDTAGITDETSKCIYLEKFLLAERFNKGEINHEEFYSKMTDFWVKWNPDAPGFRMGYDAIFVTRLMAIAEKLGECFQKNPVYVATKYFGLAFDDLYRRSCESSRRILIENAIETVRGKRGSI